LAIRYIISADSALSCFQSLLADLDQDFVEVRVGVDQWKLGRARREHDLVDLTAEGDLRAKDAGEGSTALALASAG